MNKEKFNRLFERHGIFDICEPCFLRDGDDRLKDTINSKCINHSDYCTFGDCCKQRGAIFLDQCLSHARETSTAYCKICRGKIPQCTSCGKSVVHTDDPDEKRRCKVNTVCKDCENSRSPTVESVSAGTDTVPLPVPSEMSGGGSSVASARHSNFCNYCSDRRTCWCGNPLQHVPPSKKIKSCHVFTLCTTHMVEYMSSSTISHTVESVPKQPP